MLFIKHIQATVFSNNAQGS